MSFLISYFAGIYMLLNSTIEQVLIQLDIRAIEDYVIIIIQRGKNKIFY